MSCLGAGGTLDPFCILSTKVNVERNIQQNILYLTVLYCIIQNVLRYDIGLGIELIYDTGLMLTRHVPFKAYPSGHNHVHTVVSCT